MASLDTPAQAQPMASTSSSSAVSDDTSQTGGYSSSSSSSIYRHPFASFSFGPSSSPPKTADGNTASLSSRLEAASLGQHQHRLYSTPSSDHLMPSSSDYSNGHTVPPSPALSYASSHNSMDGYEANSPGASSVSSFSSYHNRGDLADVEDLELGETELETVSELDEEQYSTAGSDGLVLESDDDYHQNHSSAEGLSFGDKLHRRRTITQPHSSHAPPLHSAQGYHGLSHFSPRSGGHGLSHHSRWTSKAPASVAARRRKGRIAQLAEEGAGEHGGIINTTKMPAKDAAGRTANNSSSPLSQGNGAHSSGQGGSHPHNRCDFTYPGTPPSTLWSEFSGPPALPVRPVSPSETIPAVPSPLCECVNASMGETAETTAAADTGATSTTPLQAPTPRRDILDAVTAYELLADHSASSPPSPSSITTSRTASSIASSLESSAVRPSSPGTTPPTSPIKTFEHHRQSAPTSPVRDRRSGSPLKSLAPLRPCFSRRNSTQSGRSTRESSTERGDRGRCHVRFSPAPPQTIRTHSPVDYDRSSCPVNHRLSVEDVEEMQNLDMGMDLLSAKCSAIAALTSCKLPKNLAKTPSDEPPILDEGNREPGTSPPKLAHTKSEGSLSTPKAKDMAVQRFRRDSTGGLLGSRGYGPPSPATDESSLPFSTISSNDAATKSDVLKTKQMTPAEHLRLQREKERERACRMAGIGTGLGGRNLGKGIRGQTTNPLIARFGLKAPPPPLPSATSFGRNAATAPSTPTLSCFSDLSREPSQSPRLPPAASVQPPSRAEERTAIRARAASDAAASYESEVDDGGHSVRRDEVVRERGRATARKAAQIDVLSASSAARSESSSSTSTISTHSDTTTVPGLTQTSPSPPSTPHRLSVLTPTPFGAATPSTTSVAQQGDSYFSFRPAPSSSATTVASPTTPTPFSSRNSSKSPASLHPNSNTSKPRSGSGSSSTGGGFPRSVRGSGYDSPSSAYESGSEYDLLG